MEPGGAQLGAMRLSRALRAHGVHTHLLVGETTRDGRKLLEDAGVEFEIWGAAITTGLL